MADVRRPDLSDLYELLEVSPRASAEVIQAAYRVLVRAQHPDLNATADAAQRTRELNAAYHILSDPERSRQVRPRAERLAPDGSSA